jgi:hypothetical protein
MGLEQSRELQCSSKQVSKQASKQKRRRGEEERHSRFAAIRQAFRNVYMYTRPYLSTFPL